MAEGLDNREWLQFAEVLTLIPRCIAHVNQPVHVARTGAANVGSRLKRRGIPSIFEIFLITLGDSLGTQVCRVSQRLTP